MAANLLQIVDDIKSSPTVILDLNNESPFGAAELDVSPPKLRYTWSSSMLTDGSRGSSSTYENRELHLTFDVISTSQDSWAASFQTLARAVDQERFWLKYQPTGMTHPVFFYCFRASPDQVNDIAGATAYRTVSLTVMSDPWAYGLPEDISSFTITNSPASGTNKMMVGPSVLGTIKGDVETPLMLAQTAASQDGTPTDPSYLNSYSLRGGFTHSLLARNLTELTSSLDVGASVTGAGANYIDGDYKSCSFATPAMSERLFGTFSTALTPMPGLYRVLLRAVASQAGGGSNTIDYTFKVSFSTASGIYSDPVVKQVATAGIGEYAIWADLGIIQVHSTSDFGALGLAAAASTSEAPSVSIAASASAVGTVQPLRFDELLLLPVATTYGTAQTALWGTGGSGVTTTRPVVIDGVNDDMKRVYDSTTTTPFAGVPGVLAGSPEWVGGLPTVAPGANNYLTVVTRGLSTTANTCTFSGRYYPRYLYLRPAST